LNASSSNTAILCNGGNSIVTVSATGGAGGYSGTGTFSVPAGTYSYTVTDANSCTATTTGDITQPTTLNASSSNTAILCNGGNSIVTVSATGGTGAISGTGTFSVPAGTYSFTVTDANSCTATTTGTITQPSAVTATSSNTAILCHGGNSIVTVSATGGTPPYTGTGTASRSAGTYSFTVTDANSCTSTTTGTITQPDALVASSSNTAILCNGGSSTVTVSATGGTAPYTGTGTASRSAGTYSFTVTDANSCTSTTTGTITQPSALTLSLQVAACSGGNNGSITATFGGGTAPYQVKIDAGAYTTQTSPYTFTGLAAGSHTVTVRDANQCSQSMSITIPQCAPVSQITPTQTTCDQFVAGTADTLSTLQYSLKGAPAVINQVSPGVFFYWVRVTAVAGSNTFMINQTITTGNFKTLFAIQSGSNVFDTNCNTQHATITQSGATITVTFNAPTAGTYIIGVKFSASSIKGAAAPGPATTVHYQFSTAGVPGSTSGIDLKKTP
jgi:hypothetical protein